MDGGQFERSVVKCFNTYFEKYKIRAIAYRYAKANHYSPQPCDILVDCADRQFYLAIECKSFTPKGRGSKLYFSSAFSDSGKPQLDRMNKFLYHSGRTGLIAVEVSFKRRLSAYVIPFEVVYGLFNGNAKGIDLATIEEKGYALKREHGLYIM